MITLNKKHQTIPVFNQTSKITQEQVKAQSQLQAKQLASGFRGGDEGTSQLGAVNKALMVGQKSEDEKIKDLALKFLDPEITQNFLKTPVNNPPKEFVELVKELSKPEIANKVADKLNQKANELDKEGLEPEKKEFLNIVREGAQSLKYCASLTKEMQGHGSSKLAFTGRREVLTKKADKVIDSIERKTETANDVFTTFSCGKALYQHNPAAFAELAKGLVGPHADPDTLAILQRLFNFANNNNLQHLSKTVTSSFLQSDAFDAFLNQSDVLEGVASGSEALSVSDAVDAAGSNVGHFSDIFADAKGAYDFTKGYAEVLNGDVGKGVGHMCEASADLVVAHTSTLAAGAAAVKGALIGGTLGGPPGAAIGAAGAALVTKVTCSKGWKKCKKWIKDNW